MSNRLLLQFPFLDSGDIHLYSLDLATSSRRYYSYCDKVMVLNADNKLITADEDFYEDELFFDITAILSGNEECQYMGYTVRTMITEAGGKTAWLEEYGD